MTRDKLQTLNKTHEFLVHIGLACRSCNTLEYILMCDFVLVERGQEMVDEFAIFKDGDFAVHVETELGAIAC